MQCKRAGLRRVSFTGGEPFLNPEFLYQISAAAVKEEMLFGRIMTNGVWYKDKKSLETIFKRLRDSGYDGDICVSVDAFHSRNIKKIAVFIKTAASIWRRPDMASIAYVRGSREEETTAILKKVLSYLKGLHVKTAGIDLSPVGSAAGLKDPWGNRWFKEDYCKGPGNALFVMPDGDVKPCCGYATDQAGLTIGNIKRDSAAKVIKGAERNKLVRAIFTKGLTGIRKACERAEFRFPGKTGNHCFFCSYLQTKVPGTILNKALNSLKSFIVFVSLYSVFSSSVLAETTTLKKSEDYRNLDIKVVQKVNIPRWYHEGLYFDNGVIWVANGEKGNIWAIDPKTGKTLEEVCPYGEFTESISKDTDGSWLVTDWEDAKLYRSQMENSTLTHNTVLFDFSPVRPAGLVRLDDRYFVITWTRGLGTKFGILILDKEFKQAGSVVIKFIEEPAHMAWDGKDLWITSWYSRKVYRVNPNNWEVTGFFRTPFGKATGIAWDGKDLWVTGTYAGLYRIEVSDQS